MWITKHTTAKTSRARVFVISGRFGLCCYNVNPADGRGHITAQFVKSTGGFTDSFSIVSNQDSDGDGFTNGVESSAGTDPFLACGVDAWPADINNDDFSDGTDITIIAGSFGKAVPPAPARHHLAPDPVDGFVDGTDITRMAGFFGKHCAGGTPTPIPTTTPTVTPTPTPTAAGTALDFAGTNDYV